MSVKDNNLIIFQVLVSNVPAVLTFALFPILMENLSINLSGLGVFFFLTRVSILIGSFSAKYLVRRFRINQLLSLFELINFSLLISFFYFVNEKNLIFVYLTLIIRLFIIGLSNNLRNVWLKLLPDEKTNIFTATLTSTIIQVSYIFAGIIYIFAPSNVTLYNYIILFDASTSLIGALIFNQIKTMNITYVENYSINQITKMQLPVYLIIFSIVLSLAFGGTDIMCYYYGSYIFKENYGYGVTTILYSIGFYWGFKIATIFNLFSIRNTTLIISCLLFLMLILQFQNIIIQVISFTLVFVLYGALYIFQDQVWFKLINSQNASTQFAYKDLIISIMLASGEIFYSHLNSGGFIIRIIFLLILFICLIIYRDNFQKLK